MFKNRKNNKKGFTLVEVIVVLVILAILAAIMIPALTGWIDKANKKTAVVEARTVLLALQTEVSENYAAKTGTTEAIKVDNKKILAYGNDVTSDMEKLTDIDKIGEKVTAATPDGSTISTFTYTTDKYVVTYANKKFTVADK